MTLTPSNLEKVRRALEEMKLFAAQMESMIQMKCAPWDGMTAQSELAHYHADKALATLRAAEVEAPELTEGELRDAAGEAKP